MRPTPSKLVAALALAFAAHLPGALAATPYETAIADARSGRFDTAIPALEHLTQANPRRLAYRLDLIAVLSWAERHADALAMSSALTLTPQTPPYVLAAIGKSALSQGDIARATEAYTALARRQPGNPDAALGLALALLADGQQARADRELGRVQRIAAKRPAVLRSAFDALIARNEPERAEAFRARLQAMGQMVPEYRAAAPAVIAEPAPLARVTVQSPAVEGARIGDSNAPVNQLTEGQALNGQHIRAAEELLDRDFTLERYRLIDAAIEENTALIGRAEALGAAPVLLRLKRDRIVALRDRGLMKEVLEQFQTLEEAEGSQPAWVVSAAADARLTLRQPQEARLLYQRVLQQDPASGSARSGLMFAELEAENFPGAEGVLDTMLTDSQRSVGARRTQAMLLRFADRLDESEALLKALADEAPDNAGIWLDQGELLATRGLPRAAAERFEAVLRADPGNLKARIGLADATWAQGAIPEAAEAIKALQIDAPEYPGVKRLVRSWNSGKRPTLTSSVTKGFGQGRVAGNDDLVWESALYTGQFESGLRVFATHHLSDAKFNGTKASHERAAMGVEWTQRDLQVSAEAGQDLRNAKDAVWALGAGYQLSDRLSIRGRYESQTNDFPLKGRLPDAESYMGDKPTYLHGDKALVGVAYRWNESRRAAADLSHYNFNDGNRRNAFAASWFERLYSGYGRTLDLQPAFYASSNTLRDAFYFNPKRDMAVSATLTGDWLTWRRYDKSFNQRLSFTLGSYRQTSELQQDGVWGKQVYGWNAFQDGRYEHEWKWGPDISTRYAIGARRFPYDGKYETKRYIYLQINWRF